MLRLLSTDLKRLVKDKLFLIIVIIGAVFAVIVPALYKFLSEMFEMASDSDMTSMFSGKGVTFMSLSPMSDFGLILPIFVSILVYKDYSYGTIRNKIISGKSRFSVYLSLFLSSAIIICGLMLVYALLVLGISCLMFGYSANPITATEVGYLIVSFIFVLLVYLFTSALICFFCVSFGNVGLSIVVYFLLGFLGQILGQIIYQGIEALRMNGNYELLANFLDFINHCNVYYLIVYVIGVDVTYTAAEVCACIFTPIIFSALITTCGILIFRRKDLK